MPRVVRELNPERNPLARAVIDAADPDSVTLSARITSKTDMTNLLSVLRHPLHNRIGKLDLRADRNKEICDKFFSDEIVGTPVVNKIEIGEDFFF
jgi:hypothetical protein